VSGVYYDDFPGERDDLDPVPRRAQSSCTEVSARPVAKQ
jgi:hypothetical protein